MRAFALAAAIGVVGCADGGDLSPAGSSTIEVTVAPLTLPGLTDARFALTVSNGLGQPVFSRTLTSQAYGAGDGSLSFVGPCDAAANDNTVSVTLLDVTTADSAPFPLDPTTYQNPGTLTRTVACLANQDVSVSFDITILRQANQGFFDIAVSFDQIFCSAKVDCEDADGDPLALLFHGAQRARTAVVGLACTAGVDGVDTVLYRDPLVVDCGGVGTVVVDPNGDGNLVEGEGYTGTDGILFGAAVYRGEEQLGFGKRYWNVLLGLDDGAISCRLTSKATASDGLFAGLETPQGATYPFIDYNVSLTNSTGGLACSTHPINGVGEHAGVTTDYSALASREAFAIGWSPPLTVTACYPLPAGDIKAWYKAEDDGTDEVSAGVLSVQGGAGYADSPVGRGFSFDGSNDYAWINPTSAHLPPGSFSIEAWFKTSSAGAQNIAQLYECAGSCPSGSNSHLLYYVSAGSVRFYFRDTDGGGFPGESYGQYISSTRTDLADGEWHHAVVMRYLDPDNSANNVLSVYVDGVLDGQEALHPGLVSAVADDDHGEVDPFVIGADRAPNTTALTRHFSGGLDEITIYHRALTAAEVAGIYAAPKGKCTQSCGYLCQ